MNAMSWEHAEVCGCRACRAIVEIRRRCEQRQEPLFVCDCRPFNAGFQVADIRSLFVAPTAERTPYPTAEDAAARVFETQQHCDVFLSTWPVKAAGEPDYRWAAVEILSSAAQH